MKKNYTSRKGKKRSTVIIPAPIPDIIIADVNLDSTTVDMLEESTGDVHRDLELIKQYLPQNSHPVFSRLRHTFTSSDARKVHSVVQIATRLIEMPAVSGEERLYCVLARWHIRNELLYLESRFSFGDGAKNIEHITLGLQEIAKDDELIENFIEAFARNMDAYPEDTREKLAQALGYCANLYLSIPAVFAQKLSHESGLSDFISEQRWEKCLELYQTAVSRCQKIHDLVNQLLEMQRQSLQKPGSAGSSGAQRNAGILAMLPALQTAREKIDTLHELIFNAYLPKTSPFIHSFLNHPGFDRPYLASESLMATNVFVNLVIVIRNHPLAFENPELYSAVRTWIEHPERLRHLSQWLFKMTNNVIGILLNNDKSSSYQLDVSVDLPWYQLLFESQKVLLFFYKMFENTTNHELAGFCNNIVMELWKYHQACFKLAAFDYHEKTKESDAGRYHLQRAAYFESFCAIQERLTIILQRVCHPDNLEGLSKAQIEKSYHERFKHLRSMLRLQYANLNLMFLENRLDSVEQCIQNVQLLKSLLTQSSTDLKSKPGVSEAVDTMEMPDNYTELALNLLASPHSEALNLARSLWFGLNAIFTDSPDNEPGRDISDALETCNALQASLSELLVSTIALADVARIMNEKIPLLLPRISTGVLSHRFQLAKSFETLLERFSKPLDVQHFDQFLLKIAVVALKVHLTKVKNNAQSALQEIQAPRVRDLIASLDKEPARVAQDRLQTLAATDVDSVETCLQCPVFLALLERGLQARKNWEQVNLGALSKLFVQLTQAERTERIQSILFAVFVTRCQQGKPRSRADLVEMYLALHNLFLAIPMQGDFIKNPRLKKAGLAVLDIFLKEVLHWSEEGELKRANNVLSEANALWEGLREICTPDEILHYDNQISRTLSTKSNRESYPELLAFLKNPHIANVQTKDFWPPVIRHHEVADRIQKFQSAWYALSYNSGIIQKREEARALYQAWLKELSKCEVKTTKNLLTLGWQAHYKRFLECMPLSDRLQVHPETLYAVKAPELCQTSDKGTVKALLESSRLRAIEAHNQKSKAKSLAPKAAKRARGVGKKGRKSAPIMSAYEAVSSSTPVFLGDASQKLDIMDVAAEHENATRNEDFDAPTAAASTASGTDISAVSPVQLPPGYQNSPFVQHILETIEKAGYQAYIIGGFVRDTLLGLTPEDADLLTNCPSDILTTLFAEIEKSKYCTDVDVFHLKNPEGGSLVVDITCGKGDTLEKLLSNADFTVNCFAINSKSQLLIPFPQSVNDLQSRKLRTLIPFEESIQKDGVRLLRLIRLGNELRWELDPESAEAIPRVRHHLSSIPLMTLIKQIRKCFPVNADVALANLESFLKHGLLPAIFSEKPVTISVSPALSDFIRRALLVILAGDERERMEDVLAVFSLTLMSTKKEITDGVDAWLKRIVPIHDQRRAILLAEWLPKKIAKYHALSPLKMFNPLACEFDPNKVLETRQSEPIIPAVQELFKAYRNAFFSGSGHTATMASSSNSPHPMPQWP